MLDRCYIQDLPLYLWAEAVNTAVYILNRYLKNRTRNGTPYELWNGKKADLSHLKTFGCTAYMHIPKQQRTKLQPKSKKYIFADYDGDSNNYRLFDPETRKIKISRDVIFNEDFDNSKPRENIVGIKLNNEEDTIREHLVEEEEHQDVEDNLENDFHQVEEIHEEETQTRKLRPRQNLKQPDRYCANLVEIDEPETYEEVKSPQAKEWISAINEELTALKNNNTWELQELPIDKKGNRF